VLEVHQLLLPCPILYVDAVLSCAQRQLIPLAWHVLLLASVQEVLKKSGVDGLHADVPHPILPKTD
jgi:hypothetical protein